MLSKLRMWLMGVPLEAIRFSKSGFPASNTHKITYLEHIAETFLTGYHRAIETADLLLTAAAIESEVGLSVRGFAYEGAAMGFTILDLLTPWKNNRLADFVCQRAERHHYMSIVGAGWAYARLKRRLNTGLDRIDPVFGWLVMDGYGFHEGFFDWENCYQHQKVPPHIAGYAGRVFDQGLGRALWFVAGADIPQISQMLDQFSIERRADLWSGVGLAATYAGGVTPDELRLLRLSAGPYTGKLAQGSVFAAAARHRAANPVEHNQIACEILSGLSIPEAAQLVDDTVKSMSVSSQSAERPAYEVLRSSIIYTLEANKV